MTDKPWPRTRLKNLVEPVQPGVWGAEPEGDANDILCVRVADFDRQRYGLKSVDTVRSVTERDRTARLLRAGDILLEKSGGTDANPVGFTVMFDGDYPAVSSNFIGRVRVLDSQHSRFWLFALAASYLTRRTQKCVKQTTGIQNLDQDAFFNEVFVVPSLGEQRAIADYLDLETARIDTLIEEQQRLIETLRERREATIRSALLSGVDGADTAPSGVDLLGAVPKHWQMVPTRYLCTITTGSEDSGNATDDGEYRFYVRGREVLRIDHYSFNGEAVMTPGDGQGGTGKVFHYFDGKFEAHQRVYVFTGFTEVTGWYFYYFLSTFLRPVALAGSNTVTMESLRRPLLADFKVAVPPLDEQQRITEYLDDQTAKIDALIAETGQFIELSKERRAALITAAVTGQIDVRESA